ncbi:MAG: SAM-dependent methyltransferase [Eubacterium sp.]|nr:SAM-dependent methyltransferase [Eubacterium sp.]
MLKLSERLKACADLVKEGSRLADIGCDHGYIPVYLVETGRIKSAVACDINEGPLSSCKALVKEYALEGKISCVLSDGFDKINKDDFDCALLAGMGGELIAALLSRCAYIKEKRLIINPMTHPELARKWLYENGFSIINDIIIKDTAHSYSVFDATYTGVKTEVNDTKLFLGEIKDFSNKEYFIHLLNYLENKQKGGFDYEETIKRLKEIINDNR